MVQANGDEWNRTTKIHNVLCRQYGHHTGQLSGLIGLNAFDQAMGYGTAKNTDVQYVIFFHVIDIDAFATQKTQIFDSFLRGTDIFTLTLNGFEYGLSHDHFAPTC